MPLARESSARFDIAEETTEIRRILMSHKSPRPIGIRQLNRPGFSGEFFDLMECPRFGRDFRSMI